MRIAIIAAVALVAGCATPEQMAMSRAANRLAAQGEAQRQAAYTATPDGQAYEACKTKVQFAMAGHHSRTFLDLEGTAKANQLHANCLDYWRRTGQMP